MNEKLKAPPGLKAFLERKLAMGDEAFAESLEISRLKRKEFAKALEQPIQFPINNTALQNMSVNKRIILIASALFQRFFPHRSLNDMRIYWEGMIGTDVSDMSKVAVAGGLARGPAKEEDVPASIVSAVAWAELRQHDSLSPADWENAALDRGFQPGFGEAMSKYFADR